MVRRPLSPMPRMNITEQGHRDRLFGHWKYLSNQADLVVEVSARPQVDFTRELGQVAIIKGVLDE